jgi:hypothetical protein
MTRHIQIDKGKGEQYTMIWNIIAKILINILTDLLITALTKLALSTFSAMLNTFCALLPSSQLSLAN